jgi:hypothetical protein
MNKTIKIIITVCLVSFRLSSFSQVQPVKPNLGNTSAFQVVNRDINILKNEQGNAVVHLNGKPNDGVAWINNLIFDKGKVEFDVKGKNVQQQSFVGIAFHGIDDSTFDVVYFRPFNFQSPDPLRQGHSVQYVSLPKFDWSLLRQNYPGKYESTLVKAIAAESWFHVKMIISDDDIRVYVNNDATASLVVKPLSGNKSGKIGFWVGNNSDGDFSNLSITN